MQLKPGKSRAYFASLLIIPKFPREIRDAVDDLEGNLESLPRLVESLNPVKMETITHSQLGTATDNLKHLFTVPESVRQTELMMEAGQLLEAHQAGFCF